MRRRKLTDIGTASSRPSSLSLTTEYRQYGMRTHRRVIKTLDYDLLTNTGARSILRRQEAEEEVVEGKGYVSSQPLKCL